MKLYVKAITDTDDLEPIVSMARIGLDDASNMLYYVNPDLNRIGEPYFKVYNNKTEPSASCIARISFLESKYIEHRNKDNKQPWKLNSSDKKRMIKYLNKTSKFLGVTMFQFAMYQWNNEFGFLDEVYDLETYSNPVEAYRKGFYDTIENLNHPSYLPSYLEMPDYRVL